MLHSVVQEFVLSCPSLVFLQGLSLIAVALYLPSSLCGDEPVNEAVDQPLMLQRVWLSLNPPWLTLAIIQSGLQLTGYIMINRSRPGSGRICSYGHRQLQRFAFFLHRSGRLLQKPLTSDSKSLTNMRRKVQPWHDIKKHNTAYSPAKPPFVWCNEGVEYFNVRIAGFERGLTSLGRLNAAAGDERRPSGFGFRTCHELCIVYTCNQRWLKGLLLYLPLPVTLGTLTDSPNVAGDVYNCLVDDDWLAPDWQCFKPATELLCHWKPRLPVLGSFWKLLAGILKMNRVVFVPAAHV